MTTMNTMNIMNDTRNKDMLQNQQSLTGPFITPEPYLPMLTTLGSKKETNPKDSVGIKKAPLSTVSAPVLMEVGVAMLEGARKYGRHNYRTTGVLASVYYDATIRHLMSWWEGEDLDSDSDLSHITKAIASLTVLRDSMIKGNWNDDRPPVVDKDWMKKLNQAAEKVIDKYPNAVAAHTES